MIKKKVIPEKKYVRNKNWVGLNCFLHSLQQVYKATQKTITMQQLYKWDTEQG